MHLWKENAGALGDSHGDRISGRDQGDLVGFAIPVHRPRHVFEVINVELKKFNSCPGLLRGENLPRGLSLW